MVVAQFVERLYPHNKVRSSHPVIGKLLYRTFVYCIEKTKKEKEAKNVPFLKSTLIQSTVVAIVGHFYMILPSALNETIMLMKFLV